MPTAVRVEVAVPGRRRSGTAEHSLPLVLDAGPVRLRGLIGAVVRAEIEAFRARADAESVVRVLTEASLADGLASGTVRHGGREVAADVDPDDAVARALLAHEDGLYEVFVDEEPVDDLDAVVDLDADTQLMFLRLVPLAGG